MAYGHAPSSGRARVQLAASRPRVTLISEFGLLIGGANVAVPHGVQRLVAYLAVAARPISRSRVAGQLWLDVPEWRALGNLRSALWRLRRIPAPIVASLDDRLALDSRVEVDLAVLSDSMAKLTFAAEEQSLRSLPEIVAATEVLPTWEDDWIIIERERFRELRIHALECACEALLQRGQYSAAIQAALAAIDAEPYRDTAQRLLVKAYLDEGNAAAAMRAYHTFRDLMDSELGLEPSEAMASLIGSLHRRGNAR